MPTSEEILGTLHSTANNYIYAAIAWHIILYLFLAILLVGIKPMNRRVIMLLSLLMISVSIFSGMEENFFNAIIFSLAGIISLAISFRPEVSKIKTESAWASIAGLLLILFGLIYPEFLEVSLVEYAYSSPVGLLPCPTLSVITGFTLLYGGLGSKKWSYLVAGIGVFYGLFGAFILGVWIDLVLLTGSLFIVIQLLKRRKHIMGGASDHNHLMR